MRLHSLLRILLLLALLWPAHGLAAGEGKVRFIWKTSSSTDPYTNHPDAAQQQWFREHMAAMQVYAGYFDDKLKWFPNGFAYLDAYALYNPRFYPGRSPVEQHPDWILKDAAGNRLFIPYDCNKDGSKECTQYAADISNPEFIRHQVDEAKALAAKGYRAIWVDDVNLDFRVGDGFGKHADPIDPHTGKPMTAEDWAMYFARFMQQMRASLPGMVLLHNSIWYADTGNGKGWEDPAITAEIGAAHLINLERGVNDNGLTGGKGRFAYDSLLAFVDYAHAQGTGVVFDAEWADKPDEREYSLASYLLVSSGRDLVGNDRATPDHWWAGYDLDLGDAKGPRYEWQGLWRRDFAKGIALVNRPQSPPVTVSLESAASRLDGAAAGTVTLQAKQGMVLLLK
jgi:hypothetical protein